MRKFDTFAWKVLVGPALGVAGTIAVMVYPSGHAAFCAGFPGLGL